uniref:Uncharacterized protein n=1 Tax=Sphaerodactylus townsendi TaxID=933632 RepID=A0ACB8ERR4_9SAUR
MAALTVFQFGNIKQKNSFSLYTEQMLDIKRTHCPSCKAKVMHLTTGLPVFLSLYLQTNVICKFYNLLWKQGFLKKLVCLLLLLWHNHLYFIERTVFDFTMYV